MSDIVELRHTLGAFRLDAAFEFGDGAKVTALFGPSGSGKSTVINAIAGLIQPEFGRLVLGGETLLDTDRDISVPARARRIGVVFQDTRLFPHLSVKANLLYGWQRTSVKVDSRGIDAVIALLGLERLLDRRPRTLSGGEKSRVGARSRTPDEPPRAAAR
jgi:molybdate transport system ATP-binding protein